MTERKISFMGLKEGANPLFVIRYRMPSPNRVGLTSKMKKEYEQAYFEAWTLLSSLGVKDTTSTILSRRSREEIERTINLAIMAYQKRGLRPPEFTKTSVSEEDEREWVESALKVLKEKIKKLERKLNNVKDEQEKKRLRKNIRKITQDMAEIANKELIEQALRGL